MIPGRSIFTPKGRAIITDPGIPGLTGVATDKGQFIMDDVHKIGLRDTIRAPKGHTLVVGDSANIEARMVCWIAGQEDILEKYRRGADLYCDMASSTYGRPIAKKDKKERQLGKVAVLGLGFGMGKQKFFDTATGPMWGIDIERSLTDTAVDVFRYKYDKVQDFWRFQNDVVIPHMSDGGMIYADPKNKIMTGPQRLMLPNGRLLRYPNLHQRKNPNPDSPFKVEWVFDVRENNRLIPTRLYGGKLTENIVQALARIVVLDQGVIIGQKYRVVMLVHDEIVCCVPTEQAEECKAYMKQVLSTTPDWAEGLPLGADVGIGDVYSLAK
jgi:DNA polymerase